MTIMNIIFIIYLLGVVFNFGRIFEANFEANVNNHYSVKENIIAILYSFLSWMVVPIAYCYKKIMK